MSNNVMIPQVISAMPAVPSTERDQVLHLLRTSPPPNQLSPAMLSMESSATSHIQILTPEIAAVKAQLRALKLRRKEWHQHRGRCRSLVAPIRFLPVKILELIFENLIPIDPFYHSNDYVKDSRDTRNCMDYVSRVSHFWRSVVIACPRLYAAIQPRLIARTDLQEMVLPRTVDDGLDVSIFYDEVECTRRFVSLNSHLIQHLLVVKAGWEADLAHHNGWANLTHLHIDHRYGPPRHEMFAIAPKLHTIKLSKVKIRTSVFPWAQIRVLTITWSKEDLQGALQVAHNLESLTLDEYWPSNTFSSGWNPVMEPHPSLQTLEFIVSWDWPSWGQWPFRVLHLPCLRALRFRQLKKGPMPQGQKPDTRTHRDFVPPAPEFHPFQQRSQCQIITLSIIDMPLPGKDLVEFISLMPTLQEFTLIVDKPFDDVDIFLRSLDATQETHILSKLISLSLTLMFIPETLLVTTILSRQDLGNSHVSSLEFVSVVVTEHIFGNEAIQLLVQLRGGGLRLVLEDKSSRY